MLGTGKQSLCTDCHTEGDPGVKAAGEMQQQLARLETAIKTSDELIGRAEDSGMEVGEARMEQDQARDSLTKARVAIHSLQAAHVDTDIQAGLKVTAKAEDAGRSALAERDYRRKGLGLSLIAIFVMMIGLGLYIRQIEKPSDHNTPTSKAGDLAE